MPRAFLPILNLRLGESAQTRTKPGVLSPRTFNFLPDARGFVKSYMGKRLDENHPDPNGAVNWCKKTTVTNYVRFTDYLGRERHVIACGLRILEIDESSTNRYIPIFEYPSGPKDGIESESVGESADHHYITFVVHQNVLIILNPMHPPLKWNGDEPVSFLGVRSVPHPPEVHTTDVNSWDTRNDHYLVSSMWGTGHCIRPYDMYVRTTVNYNNQTGKSDRVDTAFYYKMAYQNSRGQVGVYSATSVGWISATWDAARSTPPPIVTWDRPEDTGVDGCFLSGNPGTIKGSFGTDIVNYVIARSVGVPIQRSQAATVSDDDPAPGDWYIPGSEYMLNPVAGPDGVSYQVLATIPYTQNRHTDTSPDAALGYAIEEDNNPPVNCGIGCSFKGHVMLSGDVDNPTLVYYSKPGRMEAFPAINAYDALDDVVAVLPLSDRVCIVTKTTVEVIQLNANGYFALLRKEESQGSRFGRSLVVQKDTIFGIWNRGFGSFNGYEFSGPPNVYDELIGYIDDDKADRIHAMLDSDGNYWCCLPHGKATSHDSAAVGFDDVTSIVLHYNVKMNAWFRIDDGQAIGCMIDDGGKIYCGSYGGVYIFNDSDDPPESYLELARNSFDFDDPRGSVFYKTINEIYVYCGSTVGGEDGVAGVEIYDEENLVSPSFTANLDLIGTEKFLDHSKFDPYWDVDIWDDSSSEFVGPRPRWFGVNEYSKNVRFNAARFGFRVPSGSYAEIYAIMFDTDIEPPESQK